CLRPGMQPLNPDPMQGPILALFPIPFPDPIVPVPPTVATLAYIASDGGGGYLWRQSEDGTTWADGIPVPEQPTPWFSQAGNTPDVSGRTIWRSSISNFFA